jgi:hypothetical protein
MIVFKCGVCWWSQEALKAVGHVSPYLVEFFGAYFQDGNVSFVLEYMNRGSLQARW